MTEKRGLELDPEKFCARRSEVVGPDGQRRVRVQPPIGHGDAWSGGGVARKSPS